MRVGTGEDDEPTVPTEFQAHFTYVLEHVVRAEIGLIKWPWGVGMIAVPRIHRPVIHACRDQMGVRAERDANHFAVKFDRILHLTAVFCVPYLYDAAIVDPFLNGRAGDEQTVGAVGAVTCRFCRWAGRWKCDAWRRVPVYL